MLMGTHEKRRLIKLQPIYNALGPEKVRSVIKVHSLTGCDTTGRIFGKSKKKTFQAFLESNVDIIHAISQLGIGVVPCEDVIEKCQIFLCSLLCKKGVSITKAEDLRWKVFKDLDKDQGVDKLPPTQGAWRQHTCILLAHMQASVWEQDLVLDPIIPDKLKLGWRYEGDNLVPILSELPPAPTDVVELIRCKCGATNPESTNKCASGRCSCRAKNLPCTELCDCCADMEDCQNTDISVENDSDTE